MALIQQIRRLPTILKGIYKNAQKIIPSHKLSSSSHPYKDCQHLLSNTSVSILASRLSHIN